MPRGLAVAHVNCPIPARQRQKPAAESRSQARRPALRTPHKTNAADANGSTAEASAVQDHALASRGQQQQPPRKMVAHTTTSTGNTPGAAASATTTTIGTRIPQLRDVLVPPPAVRATEPSAGWPAAMPSEHPRPAATSTVSTSATMVTATASVGAVEGVQGASRELGESGDADMAGLRAQVLASQIALEQLTVDNGRWLTNASSNGRNSCSSNDNSSGGGVRDGASTGMPHRDEGDSMLDVHDRLIRAEAQLQLLARLEEKEMGRVAMAHDVLQRQRQRRRGGSNAAPESAPPSVDVLAAHRTSSDE
eukprot:COSAG06_NODE_1327_length_9855_cov_3.900574_7_plen_308_part_00